jgi:hypothetical protein
MYEVRESWTDQRLDDFAKHVDHRFDTVDRRFEEVDRRFEEVDKRFDKVDREFERINDRLDGMHRSMMQFGAAMLGSTVAGFLVLATLIVTQT